MTEGESGTVTPLDWELKMAAFYANLPMMRDAMAAVVGEYGHYATQYRAYFTALTEAGFTEAQALEIVKTHGWLPR